MGQNFCFNSAETSARLVTSSTYIFPIAMKRNVVRGIWFSSNEFHQENSAEIIYHISFRIWLRAGSVIFTCSIWSVLCRADNSWGKSSNKTLALIFISFTLRQVRAAGSALAFYIYFMGSHLERHKISGSSALTAWYSFSNLCSQTIAMRHGFSSLYREHRLSF
jgi:glucan phosphoethanolaminetransferase (alkaline phosphatase superfamily)